MMRLDVRRLLLRVALPVALVVLLYAVLGFFVVPRVIRSQAQDFVSQHYHRQLKLGEIRFNPFTLKLDIRDLSLPDTDAQPMIAFQHLFVDLELASVWRRGPSFKAILLEGPFARAVIRPDGKLNFADLSLPPSPEAKSEPNPKPVRLFIDHFSVQGGQVVFEDRAHPSAFRAEIKPITFDLRNFATVGQDGGTYALNAVSEAGERFSWSGSLGMSPVASRGQFEVANLQAHTIWNYLRDSVHFDLPSGVIGVAGNYDFTTADPKAIGLTVNVNNVTVTDLGVRPKGGTEDYVKLARLEVRDTKADVAKRTVTVGNVALSGGEIRAWVQAPGVVNLMELAGPPAPASSAASATASDTGSAKTHSGAANSDATGAKAGTANSSATGTPSADNAPSTDNTTKAGSTPAPPGASADGGAAWTVAVPDIAIDGLKISAEDRQVTPAVALHLNALKAHVTGFSTARTSPIAVELSSPVNGSGKIDVKADVSPDFQALKGRTELTNLDLTVLQPYIAQHTSMTLRSGLLSTKLNIERGSDGLLAVSGDTEVAKLRTIDNELQKDFVKFERLQLSGIDYKSKPASLRIRSVLAREPYARVIVESNRTINVSKVLRAPGSPEPPPPDKSGTAPTSGTPDTAGPEISAQAAVMTAANTTSAEAKSAEISSSGTNSSSDTSNGSSTNGSPTSAPSDKTAGTAASSDSGSSNKTSKRSGSPTAKKSSKRSRSKSAAKPSASPATDGGSDAMAIAIDTVRIQDGSANYADFWIQPNFAVGIQTLNGTILGLSSNPSSHAKVELRGKVDRYAPVHIWGDVNPFSATAYSDIKMNFKGVELSSVTPYSGRFAGYKIEKGKLSVDIAYKIQNRQLNAEHRFVIDQLELGDRVDSPDAIHLPLKIAIALLKDRNGVIDLDLPVTGSLDDPKFRLGPLIWKAVLGLLTKVATAPFALLGHLFGGGPQLNFIDFQPGSASLAPSEHDKLTSLLKALKDKTQLKLDVPVTFSPDLDKPGLAAAELHEKMLMLEEQPSGRKHGKTVARHKPKSPPASVPTSTASSSTPGSSATGSSTTSPAAANSTSGANSASPAGADSTDTGASSASDEESAVEALLADPATHFKLAAQLYRAQEGKGAALPESAQAVEAASKKKGAPPPDYGPAISDLEAVLLQKMTVSDGDLEALGKKRAAAIQDVLLGGGEIDPSRVFVIGTQPKLKDAPQDKVRVELALK